MELVDRISSERLSLSQLHSLPPNTHIVSTLILKHNVSNLYDQLVSVSFDKDLIMKCLDRSNRSLILFFSISKLLGEAAITMLPPSSAKAYSPMSFALIVYLNFSDVLSAEVVKLQCFKYSRLISPGHLQNDPGYCTLP